MPIFTTIISALLVALNIAGTSMIVMQVNIATTITILMIGAIGIIQLSIIDQKICQSKKKQRFLMTTS
jgi:hypothetical protein